MRQLRECGVSPRALTWRIEGERWQRVANDVVATFTGEPTHEQRLWIGQLHGGPGALVCGVAAAVLAGLRGWERDKVQVLVPYSSAVPGPLEGFRYVRSRRAVGAWRSSAPGVPRCRLEQAVLLFASAERSERTAHGILAAVVQQRLTTASRLMEVVDDLAPLRRAADLRAVLIEIDGGAQSVAELDVRRLCREHGIALPRRQTKRRDGDGRVRYTDCEWSLLGGRTLVLEVDGSFHMDADHWEDDLARQRSLSRPDLVIVRCTARELKHERAKVAMDLLRLGVPHAA